jgi:hypothetical protein
LGGQTTATHFLARLTPTLPVYLVVIGMDQHLSYLFHSSVVVVMW